MGNIKHVKKAHITKCKDAVTKGTTRATFLESKDASYEKIDIHKVKPADVLYVSKNSSGYIYSSYNTMCAQDAIISYIHTDVSNYKKANVNLTIEELFRSAGRNFK